MLVLQNPITLRSSNVILIAVCIFSLAVSFYTLVGWNRNRNECLLTILCAKMLFYVITELEYLVYVCL
uniref:G-protein coupled receptors family 1 profile domain-containing protein n=1 Tax=Anguilla anguilla TaxID=7936 RepID=A0A0E9T436_ANGAN